MVESDASDGGEMAVEGEEKVVERRFVKTGF